MKRVLLAACSLCALAASAAPGGLTAGDATNAIVGEAAGEPYAVKLGIAAALRHRAASYRRPLQGVYGFQSPVTRHSSPAVWRDAARAWAESARLDLVHGATHFGNAADVAKGTFLGLTLTVVLGTGPHKTYFFK